MTTRANCIARTAGLLLLIPRGAVAGSLVGWEKPAGNPPRYLVEADSHERHSGRFSASISCTLCAGEPPASLMQAIRADEYLGKRVRLAAYVKSADVQLWAGLWMRVDSHGRRAMAFDNMNARAIRGSTGWTRYEIVLDVPDDGAQIAFGVLLAGDGRVWADTFTLTPVDTSVEPTDVGLSPEYAEVTVGIGVPRRPRNLSFEE
jgi:hypothetical protein